MSRRPRSPACVEISGRTVAPNTCRSAFVRAATAHAAEYVDKWTVNDDRWMNDDDDRAPAPALAPVLLAAIRGHARVPTCEYILRHVSTCVGNISQQAHGAVPLLRRALSLFGPREVRALHVADTGSLELVQSMLIQDGVGTPQGRVLSRALHSLCAITSEVSWVSQGAAALIERHAATITQLDCVTDSQKGTADCALSRCHHLESLTRAWAFTPNAWLGLSQLHTLRGVNFADVPVAAVAAALPRLHTLHAGNNRQGHNFAGEEFFDDLLPRLQSFHFYGCWPEGEHESHTTTPPPPLPRLHDVDWTRLWQPTALPRGFMGAQPSSLAADLLAIANWLTTFEATCPVSPAKGPLARVRDLRVVGEPDWMRLLHAAPQLRRLTVILDRDDEKPFWLTAGEPITDPAFVHARLRHLIVGNGPPPAHVAADCAVLLRQHHFPRLRRLTVNTREYAVSMTD